MTNIDYSTDQSSDKGTNVRKVVDCHNPLSSSKQITKAMGTITKNDIMSLSAKLECYSEYVTVTSLF